MGNTITSNQNQSYTEDGSNVTLSCSYSASSGETLQWYRQYPRSAPQFLVLMLKSAEDPQRSEVDPRLMVKLNKEKTQVFLEISSVQVSDSALYYCALRPTVTQNHSLPYKNLTALREKHACTSQ